MKSPYFLRDNPAYPLGLDPSAVCRLTDEKRSPKSCLNILENFSLASTAQLFFAQKLV